MGDLKDTIVNDQFQSAYRLSKFVSRCEILILTISLIHIDFINLYVLIDSRSMLVSDRILFFDE